MPVKIGISISSNITSYGRFCELLSCSELITSSSASYPLEAWSTSPATLSDFIIWVTIKRVNWSSFAIKNLSFLSLIYAMLGISSSILLLMLLLSALLPLDSREYSDNICCLLFYRMDSLGMKLTKFSSISGLLFSRSELFIWIYLYWPLLITSDY